jgi:hypothetical protein
MRVMTSQAQFSVEATLSLTAKQADNITEALIALMEEIVDATSTKEGLTDLGLTMNCLGVFLADRLVALDYTLRATQGVEDHFHTKLLNNLLAGYRLRLKVDTITDSQFEALLKAGPTRQ